METVQGEVPPYGVKETLVVNGKTVTPRIFTSGRRSMCDDILDLTLLNSIYDPHVALSLLIVMVLISRMRCRRLVRIQSVSFQSLQCIHDLDAISIPYLHSLVRV